MKKIIVTGAVAAIAAISFAGNTASAAPAKASCFGQVHKTVNAGGVEGFDNVGQLVQAVGGQGKNAIAKSLC